MQHEIKPCDELVFRHLEQRMLEGEPPTFNEIADDIDTMEVIRSLRWLREHGYVTWVDERPRSFRILKRIPPSPDRSDELPESGQAHAHLNVFG